MLLCFFFFFKQKTAYEMRISDWSSDVCSSDLRCSGQRSSDCGNCAGGSPRGSRRTDRTPARMRTYRACCDRPAAPPVSSGPRAGCAAGRDDGGPVRRIAPQRRPEECRDGKEEFRKLSSWWPTYDYKIQ